MQRPGARLAVAVGSLALLWWCAPAPLEPPADTPDALVVTVAQLAAWCASGWLLLLAALTVAGDRRGRCGAVARRANRRLAPATVRRAVATTLGVGLALGVGGGAAAAQSPRAGQPAPAVRVVDGGLDWPQPAAHPVPLPAVRHRHEPGTRQATADVVVRPGDTLWALAAARLGPAPSDRRVARAWPAWWHANREVVGDDPNLLLPGQHLRPPG